MIEPKTKRIGPQLPSSSRLLDFGDQIRAFATHVGESVGEVHKNVSMKLFTAIVYDTPVDTGQARGGWNASMGTPNLAPNYRIDKAGDKVKAEIEVTVTTDYTQVAFLSNAVGHIVPLEYGWSNQSKEGMVRINVARFQGIIREELSKRAT